MTSRDKLILRIRGFRSGAGGGAPNKNSESDFQIGFEAGRKALEEYYHDLTQEFGGVLSPLRAEDFV